MTPCRYEGYTDIMSVNKVILVGRLGQDPEVKFTPSGQAVANFSIATSEVWMDKSNQKQSLERK